MDLNLLIAITSMVFAIVLAVYMILRQKDESMLNEHYFSEYEHLVQNVNFLIEDLKEVNTLSPISNTKDCIKKLTRILEQHKWVISDD